ncbi:hypothetical protein [Arthrobacter sp. fls2-241-R2A-172]|uniref:hypothetical protein n=1 Tax=Arthrobacter sp. fls2-241-R2A-172 TaxID=3040325 RepID=UPI00254C838D|nr:hypothetical protein [Arthrobacter sp. fls2-241-R2A-172]
MKPAKESKANPSGTIHHGEGIPDEPGNAVVPMLANLLDRNHHGDPAVFCEQSLSSAVGFLLRGAEVMTAVVIYCDFELRKGEMGPHHFPAKGVANDVAQHRFGQERAANGESQPCLWGGIGSDACQFQRRTCFPNASCAAMPINLGFQILDRTERHPVMPKASRLPTDEMIRGRNEVLEGKHRGEIEPCPGRTGDRNAVHLANIPTR